MCDINEDNADKIVGFCREHSIEVVGKISFNPVVTEAMVNGKPIAEYALESDVAKEIENMWQKTLSALQ
jgi:MinD superfamily P-loop ATPase